MSAVALAQLEHCHEALIGALDSEDIDALELSIDALRRAVETARNTGGWCDTPDVKERASRISALAQAAMMRVNFLTDMTAQRMEILATVRGRTGSASSYRRESR